MGGADDTRSTPGMARRSGGTARAGGWPGMLGPETLVDPNVLVLCFVALFYLGVKALALYDRFVAGGAPSGEPADGPRPR